MRYREVEKRLRELGCVELKTKGGSHRKWLNPASGRAAAVPDWGTRDMKTGTLRGAVKQLGFTWEEFVA